MASIENRIVRMEFDNAAFEQKIQSTLSSINDLNKALKFEGAGKGLSDLKNINLDAALSNINNLNKATKFEGAGKGLADLQSSANKFNLESIGTHIEGVSAKFFALGTVAFTVLQNITNKAMQTGEQLIKSLSLDLVLSGFREYELNINSIQTILSNTRKDATTLDDVTAALGKLNEYADKTIYNFGQMTRNIGTFTAAGVSLDTSVRAIQGISNLAAMSGSSADQASTAMYQLSQALASGELKLMDWNSVVNAGMGGEMFQNMLFETAKALGTLQKTDISDTFTHWKDAGNSFRDTLKTGWVNTDVLTTALEIFGGEMTKEQLVAKGFSEDVAADFIEIGKMGVRAATEVRTFTGLIDTTKEAIGSGWSESFRILIGNFEEASKLFTSISGTIGDMVKRSADARNTLLQTWKDMGGRALLIEALRTAFQNLAEIMNPIKEAFREVFPKTTAFQLMDLTKAFELLMIKLRPSKETIENIHSIFKGFFSALQIGWEIIKEGTQFFGRLFKAIGVGSGGFLEFAAKIGDFFTELNNKLVEGKGIENFFNNLTTIIQPAINILNDLIDTVTNFFNSFNTEALDVSSDSVERISSRFDNLGQIFQKVTGLWEPLLEGLEKVKDTLDQIWDVISDWFGELGQKLADAFEPGDLDTLFEAMNVALLGGITALLYGFFKKGVKVDFGGGLLSSIKDAFTELTGVLTALQTQIKADALLKIAKAVGILAASVLVISLIDPKKLSASLAAMAIGFTQLMGAFAVLTKLLATGPKGAATFDMVAAGMILLSTSILVLSGAMFVLSKLSWEEIAKGTTTITALLGVLTGVAVLLSKYSGSFISASIGLTQIAVAINLLAIAMKIFATMTWEEIGKGMAAIAGGLGLIAAALNFMPLDMVLTSVGLIAVSTALLILGGAMKIFATLSWEEIGKGMVVIAGGLGLIAAAMNLMPATTPLIAAGVLMVGVALVAIGTAMKIMGSMSWSEIGRGLTVLAGSLLILAVGVTAMSFALPGAIALGIIAPALIGLSVALKAFAGISWSELLTGLTAMAGVLAVLGGAAFILQSVTPALMGLGAALILIGGGFALFGIGVAFMANGLKILAEVGEEAIKMIPELVKAFAKGIPALMSGFAEGLLEMATELAKGAPILVEALVVLLGQLLDGLIVLIPKALVIMAQLINGLLDYIKNNAPRFVAAGVAVIIAFLQGVRDNIKEIVSIVADIIKNFLDAFAKEMPGLTESLANLIIEMFKDVAFQLGRIAPILLIDTGVAFMKGLYTGITESAAGGVIKWFKELAGSVLGWIGDVVKTLWQKGIDLIGGLFTGITDKIKEVNTFFTNLGSKIVEKIGDALGWLKDVGKKIIEGLGNGILEEWNALRGIARWFRDMGERIISSLPNPLDLLKDIGRKIIQGLWNGMIEIWEQVKKWLWDIPLKIPGWIADKLGITSPSKVMMDLGNYVFLGFKVGMQDEWNQTEKWLGSVDPASAMSGNLAKSMSKVISGVADQLGTMSDFNPTITPVLDLTEVKSGAQKLNDYISTAQAMTISASYNQAKTIATSPSNVLTPTTIEDPTKTATGVNFEQNIYAPTQLSTSDIYKQTRNQIAMAKEELSIL